MHFTPKFSSIAESDISPRLYVLMEKRYPESWPEPYHRVSPLRRCKPMKIYPHTKIHFKEETVSQPALRPRSWPQPPRIALHPLHSSTLSNLLFHSLVEAMRRDDPEWRHS